MPPPPFPSMEPRRMDPRIWRACAGNSVEVPTVHSRVYYFAQGHAEQSPSAPTLSRIALAKPFVLCRISAVDFFADPVTDEVFAKLCLVPLNPRSNSPIVESAVDSQFVLTRESRTDGSVARDENEDKILAFAKILTPSDANNGGGFSVPRFCADSIFPPLNFQAEPPVQTLTLTDVHGTRWDFRHIYRGTPRRHLLTTGWSKFVNHKKLIAGDSVVFMRNSQGHLFVGVRRAVRFQSADCSRWREQIGGGGVRVKLEEEGFSRSGRGRVPPEAVAQAAERAAQGFPFEVLYYPKMGSADFVVRAEAVEAALNVFWTPGMRVKMAMETEDSSKMTWFQGTVAAASVPESGPWCGSPWRMLQVTWDESEVLQNAKRVSPWQVEIVAATPSLHVAFPSTKKIRLHENSGLLTDGDGEFFFPITGSPNSTMTSIDASLLTYNPFPAGMQGARQDTFSTFCFSDLLNGNAPQMCTDNIYGNNMVPKLQRVSTELNIGSSQSENLSPDSQSSIHSFGTEVIGNQGRNSTKVGVTSFQLFGKVIQMNQPVANGFDEDGDSENDGCKRLDVECRGASAIEACPL
ncbi:auxin response factor 17 isoform X2 [Tripterygium wilfordii]|uniref:auxin response factor 17 isoform X2 n=1 Tax=Tripterygium wilfordii TaxID=458696 RepID=UPI0018F85092|nr:auxin response factor 17 isoform X2 [Tripterygium wilfordii]